MVTFQEDTKEAAATNEAAPEAVSAQAQVPQEPAFRTSSLRNRLRASLRYDIRQSISGLLGASKPSLNFNEQLEQCKAAPSGGRHARKSEVGELWDMEFSEEFMEDSGPKNSDEAAAAKKAAQQQQQQQINNFFGFTWGPPQKQESNTSLSISAASATATASGTGTKAKRRDSAGSLASTASAASFMSNLWSSLTQAGGNNSYNNSSATTTKSNRIESALGKLDRAQEEDEEEEDESEEYLFNQQQQNK